ncbi:hypothetical protein [Deinococcus sp. QL22]|uniref:hypothetical protein n=1 Tax=Deinococcus sp. QL22 TaxID=2939437 RepID=UPI00201704BA|nr:hypothetical protein [Deinococcus sp. QL22]UQN08325.1 hypothetical protein M1R55_16460 [Deinococcus sp. QL22]
MLSDSGQTETLLLNPLACARAAQDQPDEALALVVLRRTRHRFGGHTQAAR